LDQNLKGGLTKRKINDKSEPIYDTFIFQVEDKSKREEVIDLLNNKKFGTKNLPDAIEWHCATFWDHALDKEQIERSRPTQNLLEQMIAVPIWLRREPEDYKELALLLNNIL